jgi:hypothetical protein
MGPHEANLRGELALEQLRGIADATWPSVQTDIDRRHVVELPEVAVVPCDEALSPAGSMYGIKRPNDEKPVPISPILDAYAGRYRAWVLPLSGVAVALEPLDDEVSYLREHRRYLLALQKVTDAELVPLSELRLGGMIEFGSEPTNALFSLANYLRSGFVRAYWEGRFEKRRARPSSGDPFFTFAFGQRLVLGTLYRIRPTTTRDRVYEAVVPEEDTAGIGPYR